MNVSMHDFLYIYIIVQSIHQIISLNIQRLKITSS